MGTKTRQNTPMAPLMRGGVPSEKPPFRRVPLLLPVSVAPPDKDRLMDEGESLLKARKWEEAARLFEPLTVRYPDSTDCWFRLGVARLELGDFDGAETAAREALRLNWANNQARLCLMRVLAWNRPEDAPSVFLDAPEMSEAERQRMKYLLFEANGLLGDFSLHVAHNQAETLYFNRWPLRSFPGWDGAPFKSTTTTVPTWRGESLAGKRLLIVDRSGNGDAFQGMRSFPLLRRLFPDCRLRFAVRPALRALVEANQERLGISEVVPLEEEYLYRNISRAVLDDSGCDYVEGVACYLPLPDVHRVQNPAPYLAADSRPLPSRAEKSVSSGLKVGLVWASGAGVRDSILLANRDIDPLLLAPLSSVSGVRLFSLQKGPTEDGYRLTPGCVDLSPELHDWTDTAAYLAGLDLLITCDTGTAHLAGAMGVPCWVLLPLFHCSRWGKQETTPLYPSVRLFRQSRPEQWGPVIESVRHELQTLASGKTGISDG